MSVALVVLTGWLAATLAFVAGCLWGGRHAKALADHAARQAEIFTGLKAAQNHAGCLTVIGRLWEERDRVKDYADHLEARLDGHEDLDAELRQLTEGGGAA